MISMVKLDGRTPEPMQESTEDEEVADQTNPPAPLSLRKTAAPATFLLLRNIYSELGVQLLVGFQELFVLRIER